ncbi:hypothetical protein ACQKRQ_34230 [Paraburkholderia sp. NPDC080076]|uniref:hypothetical protein n=1 Tax=Paraburkholderia sp. NPDC080076 TaxID=3390605 RepID=UPI003D01453E
MDMTSQFATDTPAPQSSLLDPVADLVRDRYRRVRHWRAVDRIGRHTVEQVLQNSYRQYHSILDPRDAELVEASGIDLDISITKHKTDVLVAWMRDLLLNSADAPFVISPTPVPELSPMGKAQVVQQVRKQLLTQGTMAAPPGPDGILEMVRTMKAQRLAAEQDVAQAAAKGMQQQIEDQLIEASFRDELLQFLTNFALYPYAVMTGPTPEMRPVFAWHGSNPKQTLEPMLAVRNVSPFDYFYSPDSPGAGKGTFDIVRDRMTKYRLMMSATLPGYITKNVVAALDHFALPETNRDWLNPNPDKPMIGSILWGLDESIDVIRHFGLLSGRELRQYGISVDDTEYHETEAVVLGGWTIKLMTNPNPNVSERPIYATPTSAHRASSRATASASSCATSSAHSWPRCVARWRTSAIRWRRWARSTTGASSATWLKTRSATSWRARWCRSIPIRRRAAGPRTTFIPCRASHPRRCSSCSSSSTWQTGGRDFRPRFPASRSARV